MPRDKYWLWSVRHIETNTLLYIGLGRKKDVQYRWHKLTDNLKDTPLLLWEKLKQLRTRRYKFEVYDTFDWKPDAIQQMLTLRRQYRHLIVEDLTVEGLL